ncbi:MAG: DeoR/GlpR transcriptional regulator [Bacteroidales bacterium]|nr:DeoR/GlpR transcriptional regulator [Bacteroidales bacterium]
MLASQRRDNIYKLIKENGQASVSYLSEVFSVSEVTIRQDLITLEEMDLIKREYGGAVLKDVDVYSRTLSLANTSHMPEKQAIAKEAFKLVKRNDTIILDSGSTVTELAKLLVEVSGITVITNALNIALILGVNPGINLIVTGGEFKAPTLSLTGEKAAQFFNGLHADKLFLATAGMAIKSGLTYPSLSDICVKKAMIESSATTYLLADSSKLEQSSFAKLGDLSLVDVLITDSHMDSEKERLLVSNGVKYIKAKPLKI